MPGSLLVCASAATHSPADVPVTPDADEARRWAEEELSRGVYAPRTGLLERFVEWLAGWLDALSAYAGGSPVVPVAIVVLVTAAVVAALVIGPPLRRRRDRIPTRGVLDGEPRSAAELRAAADDAGARGDYTAAVLDRFRAIVRDLADRALVTDAPGVTAHEAASAAGVRLPGLAGDLVRASELFDRVRYGRRTADASADTWLADLDRRVRSTRASEERAAPATTVPGPHTGPGRAP